MSWRYCETCDCGVDEPTIEEDLGYGGWVCPHCDAGLGRGFSDAEWILKLSETIQELSEEIQELRDKI